MAARQQLPCRCRRIGFRFVSRTELGDLHGEGGGGGVCALSCVWMYTNVFAWSVGVICWLELLESVYFLSGGDSGQRQHGT